MIPGNALSASLAISPFVPPDELYTWCKKLIDYEEGGIALNNPTQGLRVQQWRIVAKGPVVTIDAPNNPAILPTTLYTASSSISEISLTFDQNMAPTLAFVEGGQARFWYFDTDTQSRQVLELVGCTSPRCFLDDKRSSQTAASDIILVYLRAGALYYRQQRDRYLTERKLKDTEAIGIARCGMTHGNRVQVELAFGTDYPAPSICLFGLIDEAMPNEYYESEEVLLNQWVPIDTEARILGGEYKYKWNQFAEWTDWTTSPINVAASGILKARGQALNAFDATRTVRITIGDIVCSFPITTYDCAEAFQFTALTGQALLANIESNIVTTTNCVLPNNNSISVSNGEYSIKVGEEWGPWQTSGTIDPNTEFRVRLSTPNTFNVELIATVTIGQFTRTFSVTTFDSTGAPNFIEFSPITNANLSEWRVSNAITVSIAVLHFSPISVVNGEYRISIDGITWSDWTSADGIVSPGALIETRVFASADFETEICASLSIAQFTNSFCVTTRSESNCVEIYVRPNYDSINVSSAGQLPYERPEFDDVAIDTLPPC